MFCEKCGKEIADGAKFCMFCGNQTASAEEEMSGEKVQEFEGNADNHGTDQGAYSSQNYNNASAGYGNAQAQPEHGKAVAALVLGIVSLVVPYLNLATSIVGICLAASAKKAGNTEGIRKAGMILSIIGLCWAAGIIIFGIAAAGTMTCLSLSYYF